jgi:hypothetical protein
MKVEKHQVWTSNQDEFVVLQVIDLNGQTWVHYRNMKTGQEHSCYEESFEQRFTPALNRY